MKEEISESQKMVLRMLLRHRLKYGSVELQIAGHGRGPHLSAARSLVRKGFAETYHTGHFSLTTSGVLQAEKALQEYDRKQNPYNR